MDGSTDGWIDASRKGGVSIEKAIYSASCYYKAIVANHRACYTLVFLPLFLFVFRV